MEKELYMAAMTGDTGFLIEARAREIEAGYWDEYLASKTRQKNNIIHIASLHGHVDFIHNVLTLINLSPLKLISQKNSDGDTPLHIASKKGNSAIVHLLVQNVIGDPAETGGKIIEVAEDGDDKGEERQRQRPWRIGNSEGNTPLHEAINHGRIQVARYLVELDDEATCLVNNRKETPLHLAVKHNANDDKQMVIDAIELMNKQHASLTYKASKWPTKEESLSMIRLLLHKSSVPVYMRDEDGLTPLLRAASASHVSAIQAIVREFPETVETRNYDSQTMLHLVKIESYEEAKSLMRIPQIACLKDEQDSFGNTPAIVVIKNIIKHDQSQTNRGVGMLKALLASSANFSIKNKEGYSAADLMQQHKTKFSNIRQGQLDEEFKAESKPGDSPIPEEEISKLREAIENANLVYLTERINILGNALSFYGCLGSGNILHGVLKARKVNGNNDELILFVEKVLQRFPILLFQPDFKGDTPLHILIRDYPILDQSFLDQIMNYYEKSQLDLANDEQLYCSPWKLKNVQGNTPLHNAFLNSQSVDKIVLLLVNTDTSVFAFLNYQNETPLHVLCRRSDRLEDSEQVTRQVLEAYKLAAYKRDADGLTPLLRAAQTGNINQVEIICQICPQSAKLTGDKGRTFWHVIDLSKASRANERYSMNGLLKNEEIKQLLNVQDDEGNTPVKLAIQDRNFHLLKALKPCPDVYAEVEETLRKGDIETQLLLPTIAYANLLPSKLEQILWEILKKVPEKSFFGVLESEISNYTQTLGVIAVLLATIAFTAAFTVPGGFRQGHEYLNKNGTSVPFNINSTGEPDNPNITSDIIGTPVLLGSNLIPFLTRAAYWTFMVSDIITMCLSTFVIYCLLWIMKNTEMKMVLIDISIFTIQICFYTTMITFMMGVFATTLLVDSSLAYLALVVCSFLMLLMNRWLFPVKTIFLCFAVGYEVIVQAMERYFKFRRLAPLGNKATMC